jgi:hypothetical protein
MPSPQQVTNGWSQGDFQLATLPQDNPTQPSNLGNSTYAFFYTYSAYHPDSGPNNGLYIVYAANGQSTLNDTSMYPWELSPALLNSSSAFYQAQSGSCWSGAHKLDSEPRGWPFFEPLQRGQGGAGREQPRRLRRGFRWR